MFANDRLRILGPFFAVIIVLWTVVSCGDEPDPAIEASSLLSAVADNNNGLRRYDVSIERREDRLQPDGVLTSETSIERFLVDRDVNAFALVRKRESESSVTSVPTASPDGKRQVRGIVCLNDDGWEVPIASAPTAALAP